MVSHSCLLSTMTLKVLLGVGHSSLAPSLLSSLVVVLFCCWLLLSLSLSCVWLWGWLRCFLLCGPASGLLWSLLLFGVVLTMGLGGKWWSIK